MLTSNRNWVSAWAHIARCKTIIGPLDEAIPLLEHAIRLSPRDPDIGNWYYRVGIVHLLQSRTDEAIQWFEKACSFSRIPYLHLFLASAYALKGETTRAGAELAEARQLGGEGSFPNIRARDPQLLGAHPDILRLYEATYFAGLRKAGMSEG